MFYCACIAHVPLILFYILESEEAVMFTDAIGIMKLFAPM